MTNLVRVQNPRSSAETFWEEWRTPLVIGVGTAFLLKKTPLVTRARELLVETIDTDEGWNRMSMLYLGVIAATFFIALRYKHTRPFIATWWWA